MNGAATEATRSTYRRWVWLGSVLLLVVLCGGNCVSALLPQFLGGGLPGYRVILCAAPYFTRGGGLGGMVVRGWAAGPLPFSPFALPRLVGWCLVLPQAGWQTPYFNFNWKVP